MRLEVGAHGPQVAELQRRLDSLGLDAGGDGRYDDHTRQAVREFQRRRRLRVDGICGPETWSALVEASFRLGDRVLFRQSPMLRGDDVAELQERLGALGFDAGRVDGIFGDDTKRALVEFQRNAGLPADGICGSRAVTELRRLERQVDQGDPVAAIKEREALRRTPRTLLGYRVVVGHGGPLDTLAEAVRQAIAAEGAFAVVVHDPDDSHRAERANAVDAQVYLEFQPSSEPSRFTTAYYAGYRFRSAGGQRLAELLEERFSSALRRPAGRVVGMSLPVLRETKMPAVVCEVLVPEAGESATLLTRPIVDALRAWLLEAWE
ncbi:MAG: peptidoglycan-binding protein [Acidimicrobiales bacterium]|nr:peptidoglycan-binding protein [Acidimicrobiales bacterium]